MSLSGAVCRIALAMISVLPIRCRADHLDRIHHALGAAEVLLSGVHINSPRHGVINEVGVYIEPMAAVLKSLGKPIKIIEENNCESSYIWVVEAVRTEVSSGCVFQRLLTKDVMRTHGAYAVDVWGTQALGRMGTTGKGLALGDSWSKVQKIYGTRCNCGRYTTGAGAQNTHGLKYAVYARYLWKNGIELDLDADKDGRVVHMLLLGDIE